VTTTPQGIPGDPLNIGLVGSGPEVVGAMAAAGWHPADPITFESSAEIGISVVLHRPYQDAPVSTLMYQDAARTSPSRSNGTNAAHRHHAAAGVGDGRGPPRMAGPRSTRSVGVSHRTGQITHHIDPDLDTERQVFIDS
jgi:hypothetical protein